MVEADAGATDSARVSLPRTFFFPYSSYATVRNNGAHYMGVPEGARIWEGIEARWEDLLLPEAEQRLIAHPAKQFG